MIVRNASVRQIHRSTFGFALLLVTGVSTSLRLANAASFDCTQTLSNVERAICSNQELSDLDDQLHREYRDAAQYGHIPGLRSTQRHWIRSRDDCRTRTVSLQLIRGDLQNSNEQGASISRAVLDQCRRATSACGEPHCNRTPATNRTSTP